jgi:D-amino peptidase
VRPTIFGAITKYDLILYVVIHAASGTQCEIEFYGGSFGELGISIGFVSGEDIAVLEQAVRPMPWLKTVCVDKKKERYSSGKSSMTI